MIITLVLILLTVISVGLFFAYHFLLFPNIDGIAQNLSWFRYDSQSQHYLYWFFFWFLIILYWLKGIRYTTKSS